MILYESLKDFPIGDCGMCRVTDSADSVLWWAVISKAQLHKVASLSTGKNSLKYHQLRWGDKVMFIMAGQARWWHGKMAVPRVINSFLYPDSFQIRAVILCKSCSRHLTRSQIGQSWCKQSFHSSQIGYSTLLLRGFCTILFCHVCVRSGLLMGFHEHFMHTIISCSTVTTTTSMHQ